MRRLGYVATLTFVFSHSLAAQAPEPPRPLPPSIAGTSRPLNATPTAGPNAPTLAKFEPIVSFTQATQQAVLGVRSASAWLARRQLVHGRFTYGVNPALRAPLEGDQDYKQALAAWGVAAAARISGEEKLQMVASQAVLSLLASCKDDPTDPAMKTPTFGPNQGPQVGFMAALTLAILEVHENKARSNADAAELTKLLGEADKLVRFLMKQQQPDGSIACGEGSESDRLYVHPGLTLQALARYLKVRPENGVKEPLLRGLTCYRERFRSKPHPNMAGTMIPAAVDTCLLTGNSDAAAMALEMADWLCLTQANRSDTRLVQWAGSFKTTASQPQGEPGYETAHAARGLASALQLLHRIGGLDRYAKYRPATVESIEFLRGLQYTAESTTHFEGSFRAEYLIGGCRVSVNDGNIRADATALVMLAFQQYLESGAAETR